MFARIAGHGYYGRILMWANTFERTAEERGYVIFSKYNTKEEADAVLKEMRKDNLRCFKAHHVLKLLDIDVWLVWWQPPKKEGE